MIRRKKYIIIEIIIIFGTLFAIFILSNINKYDNVMKSVEKKTLFARIYRPVPYEGVYTIKALDNQGNIYHYLATEEESWMNIIESGKIYDGSIVGYVSTGETMKYYNSIRNINKSLLYTPIEKGYAETDSIIVYYAILYKDNVMDILCVGSTESVANSSQAKRAVVWMEEWEWEIE